MVLTTLELGSLMLHTPGFQPGEDHPCLQPVCGHVMLGRALLFLEHGSLLHRTPG